MDAQHKLERTVGAFWGPAFSRSLILSAGGVAALAAGVLCAAGGYRDAAVVAATVFGAALVIVSNISIEAILIAWFVTTPLASFFIRFPLDRSIITYNRAVFGLLVLVLLLRRGRAPRSPSASGERPQASEEPSPPESVKPRSFSITKFEAAWALLSSAALASAATKSTDPAYAARIAVDSFLLPLIAFHVARSHFDLRLSGRALVLGAIALALFLIACGTIEFATGADLFRYKGSEILREGERRINGPFTSDSSYSIICLMLFLFLLAAPRLTGIRFDRLGRFAYGMALAGAAAGAMLPLFRSVAAALVLCWIVLQAGAMLERRSPGGTNPFVRLRGVGAGPLTAVIVIAIVAGAATVAPSMFESRLSDPRNAFGRLATWRAAAGLTLSSPLFGLGLGNYSEYFHEKRFYRDKRIQDVLDARAADSPHSNLLWVAAELGAIALLIYLTANFYLFRMGWRGLMRPLDSRRRIPAALFLALLIAYWIPGLALTSGEYSDLNLCFFFLLGSLSGCISRPPTS